MILGENQTGFIQTVTGKIHPDCLGITLTHEHLLVDYAFLHPPPSAAGEREFYYKNVSTETIGMIRHTGQKVYDNPRLLNIDTAIKEIMLYKQYGGNSLVDATNLSIGRDPIGLARISRATGLNIIMGGSYYVDAAHPSNMSDLSEDSIMDRIVSDITVGFGHTGLKSGIIGEIGCSWPLTNNEIKVLRASARAQRITGAPLLIHPGFADDGPMEIIDILEASGATLNKVIIGHIDAAVKDQNVLVQIAERGCYIEWDLIGKEESHFNRFTPNDSTRLEYIAGLVSKGHGDKILVAQDICDKNRLVKYGGHGYSYILSHIIPRMRSIGFDKNMIEDILVNNPRRALIFSKPQQ